MQLCGWLYAVEMRLGCQALRSDLDRIKSQCPLLRCGPSLHVAGISMQVHVRACDAGPDRLADNHAEVHVPWGSSCHGSDGAPQFGSAIALASFLQASRPFF